jgi:DNA-binding transcriptional LysR family regulator
VPRGRNLVPTAVARELAPRVAAALAAMRHVFEPSSRFDPAREKLVLRIATSDYGLVAVLRPALVQLRALAPGIDSIDGLVRGDLDLAIAPHVRAEGVEQLVFRPLVREPYACALRRGHAAAARTLTLARWLALEHVAVGNRRGNVSDIQQALDERGHERRVALVAPSFLTAAALVAHSDLVAALPRSLLAASGLALVGRPLPLRVPDIVLHLVWHPRWTTDPRHTWLRGHIAGHVTPALHAEPR